jgi:cysteinyl-tRNA synthetase
LWKIDDKHLMKWDSPWGRGFPGWHIECSAMSLKYLGGTFDIHTGGEDNIFPHHECEIAQSVGAGVGEFARIWVHARHLLVDGQKMSKSKGNFYTINDLVERGFRGHEIRYSLICNHYRQPMNFTIDGMDGDTKAVQRLRTLRKKLEEASVGSTADTEVDSQLEESKRQFDVCIDDDLNLSGALGVLHDRVRALGRDLPQGSAALLALEFLRHCDQILGVIFVEDEAPAVPLTDSQQQLIERRETARAEREWSLADEIRDQLLAEGIVIEDGPTGTTWSRQR